MAAIGLDAEKAQAFASSHPAEAQTCQLLFRGKSPVVQVSAQGSIACTASIQGIPTVLLTLLAQSLVAKGHRQQAVQLLAAFAAAHPDAGDAMTLAMACMAEVEAYPSLDGRTAAAAAACLASLVGRGVLEPQQWDSWAVLLAHASKDAATARQLLPTRNIAGLKEAELGKVVNVLLRNFREAVERCEHERVSEAYGALLDLQDKCRSPMLIGPLLECALALQEIEIQRSEDEAEAKLRAAGFDPRLTRDWNHNSTGNEKPQWYFPHPYDPQAHGVAALALVQIKVRRALPLYALTAWVNLLCVNPPAGVNRAALRGLCLTFIQANAEQGAGALALYRELARELGDSPIVEAEVGQLDKACTACAPFVPPSEMLQILGHLATLKAPAIALRELVARQLLALAGRPGLDASMLARLMEQVLDMEGPTDHVGPEQVLGALSTAEAQKTLLSALLRVPAQHLDKLVSRFVSALSRPAKRVAGQGPGVAAALRAQ